MAGVYLGFSEESIEEPLNIRFRPERLPTRAVCPEVPDAELAGALSKSMAAPERGVNRDRNGITSSVSGAIGV